MYVVAVANTKGGVGKTTLAAALATRAAQESPRVAMVDLDPQKSLVAWWERRGKSDNPTIFEGADTAFDAVEALEMTGWDWVFFDGPPAFLTTVQDAIEVANFVVVPIKPSVLDIAATEGAIALAREAGTAHLAVLNDFSKREKTVDATREALRLLKIPVAKTEIAHRVAHNRCMTAGKTAAEIDTSRNKDAAAEIEALWKEVKAATTKAARRKAREVGNE